MNKGSESTEKKYVLNMVFQSLNKNSVKSFHTKKSGIHVIKHKFSDVMIWCAQIYIIDPVFALFLHLNVI